MHPSRHRSHEALECRNRKSMLASRAVHRQPFDRCGGQAPTCDSRQPFPRAYTISSGGSPPGRRTTTPTRLHRSLAREQSSVGWTTPAGVVLARRYGHIEGRSTLTHSRSRTRSTARRFRSCCARPGVPGSRCREHMPPPWRVGIRRAVAGIPGLPSYQSWPEMRARGPSRLATSMGAVLADRVSSPLREPGKCLPEGSIHPSDR